MTQNQTAPMDKLKDRLLMLLRRHLRDSDAALSDDILVRVVFHRYEQSRREVLIDPNE